MPRLFRPVISVAMSLTLVGLAACRSGDGEPAADGERRAAAIYTTVIREITAGRPEASGGGSRRPVFVEGAGGYEVPIEVQVEVVDRMKGTERVRFIDDRAEAVVLAAAGQPVRQGGLLIVLGALAPDEDRTEVVADRYLRLDEVLRHRFTVEMVDDGEWRSVGEPITTPTTFLRRRSSS